MMAGNWRLSDETYFLSFGGFFVAKTKVKNHRQHFRRSCEEKPKWAFSLENQKLFFSGHKDLAVEISSEAILHFISLYYRRNVSNLSRYVLLS
ncbi:unnamed protein product [Citrullus colocynthis]|uniref:Uncharacterized protein n=1 Tax=Citrullus colocynthis TaxID=252529 RepID=A0ABP0XVS1_9ROSI